MPKIDQSTITQFFMEAAERGTMRAASHVVSRAQSLAPVRKIFRAGRGKAGGAQKFRRGTMVSGPFSMMSGGTFGLLTHSTAPMAMPKTLGIKDVVSGGGRGSRPEPGHGSPAPNPKVRGSAHGYSPVLKTRIGAIGGGEWAKGQTTNLRFWGGDNVMALGLIRSPAGGHVALASMLTSRGRFEAFGKVGKDGTRAGRGRAVHTSASGEQMIGGRLHDSIHAEGPFRNGMQVSGFVSASAHDPGSSHNYARDQEFGTRKHKKHPFLRPALRESAAFFRASVKLEIENRSMTKPTSSNDRDIHPVMLEVRIDTSSIESAVDKLHNTLFGA